MACFSMMPNQAAEHAAFVGAQPVSAGLLDHGGADPVGEIGIEGHRALIRRGRGVLGLHVLL